MDVRVSGFLMAIVLMVVIPIVAGCRRSDQRCRWLIICHYLPVLASGGQRSPAACGDIAQELTVNAIARLIRQ